MTVPTSAHHLGEGLLARAALSATHFTAMDLDGLPLAAAVDHYLDWIEGVRDYARRGPARASQGVHGGFDRRSLLTRGSVPSDNGCEISARSKDGQALLRFIHRDDERAEVWWYTVVRLTALPGTGVRIEHATARSVPPHLRLPPVAGAPGVVARLCSLPEVQPRSRDLAAPSLIHVGADDAEKFVRHVLFDERRSLPHLVVSATNDHGEFLVDSEILAQRLAAQAVVVSLSPGATWAFADAFEGMGFHRDFGVCFDGAVRVYQPGLVKSRNPREHYLWLPGRLREYAPNATERVAGEVAERVTWRILPPRFFAIVDDWDRNESRARADVLLHREAEEAKSFEDKTRRLAEEVAELREQLRVAQDERALWEDEATNLESKSAEWRNLLEIAEQERDEALRDRRAFEARFAALEARAQGLTPRQREVLQRKLDGDRVDSLADALLLLETCFPERVLVLTSAWKSAEESSDFKKTDKAWELMVRLVTAYWNAIQGGGGAQAKDVFSDATYSARESETVEGRDGARKRRTFDYRGTPVLMLEHLKIGVKESRAETWRLHFFFDAESRRIVIGHCGGHLDFK